MECKISFKKMCLELDNILTTYNEIIICMNVE